MATTANKGIKILHLQGKGVQGKTFSHEIEQPIVLFTGPNGAGKTTRLKALDLALRGPRKDDNRFDEDGASVHVRLKVDKAVHEGARVEIMRGLSPKHTLSLPPLVNAGSKSVTQAQGVLDGLVQVLPVTFDVRTFTDLSADKQKAALLPFATFVDAAKFADIYPAVPPYDGESGSDYLGRVRAAISEECKVLAARKLAAERAQVELANNAGHNARPAATVRLDIAQLDALIGDVAKADALRAEIEQKQVLVGDLDDYIAKLRKSMDEGNAYTGPTSVAIRAEINALEERLSAWQKQEQQRQVAESANETANRHRQWLAQVEANIAALGDAPKHHGELTMMAKRDELERARKIAQKRAVLEDGVAHLSALEADVKSLQLLPRALLAAAMACQDAARQQELLAGLNAVLLTDGFPSVANTAQQLAAARDELTALPPTETVDQLERELTVMLEMDHVHRAYRAQMDAHLAELERAQYAVKVAGEGAVPVPERTVPAPSEEELAKRTALSLQLQAAVDAERDGSQAESMRVFILQAEAERTMHQNQIADMQAQLLALGEQQELHVLRERRAALQQELDEAVRAEGKVDAERSAYASADAAGVALAAAKAAEKRAKEASDQCLRESMGTVATVFQPFCAMLGGTWRLGDDRPLGLERDGQWVDFEHLSESERLVYGIGLVLALSTLGKGLRMVMLDGLDSCDVLRRRAIVAEAHRLINAGMLDHVFGTAWSSDGFDAGVQVIDVTK